MMKKKELISIIQSLNEFRDPKIELEQYTTDAVTTVDFIYFIGIDNQDIVGNIIIDLGAGTGRLGLTALIFGASGLVAIEKDEEALYILRENAKKLGIIEKVLIIKDDIEALITKSRNLNSKIDEYNNQINDFQNRNNIKSQDCRKICIMNPPFGVHKRNADRSFLRLGMLLSEAIYSIHLSGIKNREFIKRFVKKYRWKAEISYSQKIIIKNSYDFHKKRQREILADVYRIYQQDKESP